MHNPEQRAAILKNLQARKIHVRKHVLARVPARVARHFPHPWAPVGFWLDHPVGHVVITAGEAGYVPGEVEHGRRTLAAVALIPVQSLVGEGEHPLIFVAHLFDHLLGCDGVPEGTWLSEGGGYLPAWREVGERLYKQFRLGYAASEAARANPRRYFAEGLVAYWEDRHGLRVQDPGLEAIFRTTLLDPHFWRRVYG